MYTTKKVTAEPLRYQHFKGEPNVRCSTLTPRTTALVSVSATLILALACLSGATTINVNSASQSDVAAAIRSATNGDTIIIPAGTATWTRTLPVTKAITIQGAGTGVTIVKDGVQSGPLIQWSLAAGLFSRLTGIEFQDGGRINTANAPGGLIHITGSNTDGSQFRWDHCKWNNLNGYPVTDTVIGVIDHNEIIVGTKVHEWLYPYGTYWNGASYGDGSWAAPTNFGSSQFLFIEDNTITDTDPVYVVYAIDGFGGTRFVVRHNSIFNCFVGNHGTDSTGRTRGGRAMEVYGNTFTGTNLNRFVGGARSGGVLFHDNSISGFQANPLFTLGNFRNFFPFSPWGGADGLNLWDVNEANAFFTGTAASNSSRTSVTVSGVNWATNQWAGHTIRRTSNKCNSNSIPFAWIQSNTSNTISYTDNGAYPTPSLAFRAGDTLEIRKVDHAIDQPGRAGGSLITGDTPVHPASWNDQVTEPCYSWNNGQASFSGGPGVRANVHYFNNTPMPGYTPYIYPHPLVIGNPPPSISASSPAATRTSLRRPWGGKKQQETKGVRKRGRKTKENAINEMAEGQENLDH